MEEAIPIAQKPIKRSRKYSLRTKPAKQLYTNLSVSSTSPSIRLLDLHPGHEDTPLTGTLRVVSLNSYPQFTTLSYVWGPVISPCPTITISPSGVQLSITESCFQALRHIRRSFGAVTIWVDSISINQDDNDEKASQIPLMEDIYSLADVGYFWLGEGDEGCDRGIVLLKERARFLGRLPLSYLTASSTERGRGESGMFRKRILKDIFLRLKSTRLRQMRPTTARPYDQWDSVDEPRWRTAEGESANVLAFINHPWAYRTWTFQEIILSRNPIFICGNNIILWEDIVNAVYVPDINPSISTSLAHWRSIVDVWFNFPRRACQIESESDLEIRHSRSFKRLLRQFWDEEGVSVPLLIYVACCDIVLISPPLAIYFGFRFTGADVYTPLSMMFIAFGILWVILCYTLFRHHSSQIPFLTSLHYILFGIQKGSIGGLGPYPMDTDLLNGIWTALRKRNSTEAYDKSFALSAILKRSGASPSPPDYSLTIKETYWNLFRDMVMWQRPAVTLMMDAGVQNEEENWPSWLPDWRTRERNAWLVGRYRVGDRSNAAPGYIIKRPLMTKTTIALKGQRAGHVALSFHFDKIPHENNHAQSSSALHNFTAWILAVAANPPTSKAYQVLPSALFAIVEGLTPAWTSPVITKRKSGFDIEITLKSHEAPYDFTDRQSDYRSFVSLYNFISKTSFTSLSAKMQLQELQRESSLTVYFLRMINRIVEEERCLFVLADRSSGSGISALGERDEVFLFPGVRAPILLRKKAGGGAFALMGPVLVHGLMHGEEFQDAEMEEVVLE